MNPQTAELVEQARPLPEAGEWFVLHTRSRQEKSLAADLTAMGVGCFLPMMRQVRYYGKRKMKVRLPIFPGYLFLRGTRDEAFEADRTRRVAQIITVADQAQIDAELHNLHLALDREAPLDPHPYLREGLPVEVRSGPFRGLRGVIERRTRADRLLLQIDMLGRGMSLEIDVDLLDPIE